MVLAFQVGIHIPPFKYSKCDQSLNLQDNLFYFINVDHSNCFHSIYDCKRAFLNFLGLLYWILHLPWPAHWTLQHRKQFQWIPALETYGNRHHQSHDHPWPRQEFYASWKLNRDANGLEHIEVTHTDTKHYIPDPLKLPQGYSGIP